MALVSRVSCRSTRAACDAFAAFGKRFASVPNPAAVAAIGASRGVSCSAPTHFAQRDKATELAMIKDLREKTGAPLMDVTKALKAVEFDLEGAYAELRKRGLAAASKKAGRVAAEGLIGVSVSECGQHAGLVEVNAETDFVSRNELFLALVEDAARAVVESRGAACNEHGEIGLETLENIAMPAGAKTKGATLAEAAAATAASLRENIKVRRAYIMTASGAGEVLGHYVHGAVAPGAGRQGCVVKVASRDGGAVSKEIATALANKVAMHTVAVAPRLLDPGSIPGDVLAGEMAILRSQTDGAGKPENVVEKIITGRLRKFHEEVCLVKQKFVMDDTQTVEQFVEGSVGGLLVTKFARLKVGEGIEVEVKDFAAEVAATVAESQ